MRLHNKYRIYFFDYLWWLGEKAQEYYRGEPRRPDGESMVSIYILLFGYFPPVFLSEYFNTKLPMYIALFFLVFFIVFYTWLHKKIYHRRRCEAIMRHYEGRKFSPFRVYAALFFPIVVVLGPILSYTLYIHDWKTSITPKVYREKVHQLLEQQYSDTTGLYNPSYRKHE